MTEHPQWLTQKINTNSDTAKSSTCPRCGAPTLCARAGRVAALDVTADPTPIDPTAEILARLAGRLTWHLVTTALGVHRITWRDPAHIQAGPTRWPVVADHQCAPRQATPPATLF